VSQRTLDLWSKRLDLQASEIPGRLARNLSAIAAAMRSPGLSPHLMVELAELALDQLRWATGGVVPSHGTGPRPSVN
jgi:hypothetical protein